MNVLTFDIEDWYIEKILNGNRQEKYAEYDRHLSYILDLLDQFNLKGSFFCTGKMATDFPVVVRKINECGHEIGCHSFRHTRLDKLDKEKIREDTRIAIDSLEQCVGQKVRSYRAPFFSIGDSNKWVFEILVECGIERDASVFPAKRDYGGFAQFKCKEPVLINYDGIQIKEFPVSTISLMGKNVAYSGGGFFRFFPLWLIRNHMLKADYAMTYFHISDFVPDYIEVKSRKVYEDYYKESGTLINRYKRFIKSNIGKKHALMKLTQLFESTSLVNLEQADTMTNWSEHSIKL